MLKIRFERKIFPDEKSQPKILAIISEISNRYRKRSVENIFPPKKFLIIILEKMAL